MGGGNHNCCDKTVNHSAPTAALLQTSAINLNLFIATVPSAQPVPVLLQFARGIHSPFVSASPPPLLLSSVLRI